MITETIIVDIEIPEDYPMEKVIFQCECDLDTEDHEFLKSVTGKLYKDLTPEQKKEVVNIVFKDAVCEGTTNFNYDIVDPIENPTICPYCGSNNISTTGNYDGGYDLSEECECEDCGSVWFCLYRFAGLDLTDYEE